MPDLGPLRYWAGQKLLHSPFHPLYLRLTGQTPVPKTYQRWLAAERAGPSTPLDTSRYEIITEPGVELAPDAAHWLMRRAEETGASRIYADEDCAGRHSPVFRPSQWSPELAAHCDYTGGCYLRRLDEDQPTYASVPRVLFHRRTPRIYTQAATPRPQIHTQATAIVCSRDPQLLATCLQHLANMPVVAVLHTGQGRDDQQLCNTALRFPNCTAVEYSEAFHFAKMCNLGAKQVRTEHLLFLNDDVTPISADWLSRMIAQAEKPDTGAVGALLYYPDGRIQHAGVMIGTPMGAGHPGRLSNGVAHWPWLTMTREVSAVTGACLMMPRRVFDEIGGYDEIFPVNYNDVDLCLRAAAKGYRILLEANAKMVHAESATRKTGIGYAERQTFLTRWAKQLSFGDPYLNPNLSDDELILPDPKAF